MSKRMLAVALTLVIALSVLVVAQQTGGPSASDLRYGDWHNNPPRQTHGSLVERDILTKGDSMDPPRAGALLEADINSFTYATLASRASTIPTRLAERQEVYYILSGTGKMTAGGETAELFKNIAVLIPEGLEFVMTNTGTDPLTMYLINESTTPGFKPVAKMVVKDENSIPVTFSEAVHGPLRDGHWSHIFKGVLARRDGTARIGIGTVGLGPMTIGEPHAHGAGSGSHETWTAIDGTSITLLGTQLRMMTPGMSYSPRPDGQMEHANINYGDNEVKFLFLSSGLPRSGASTEVMVPPPIYLVNNPPNDRTIDMYMANWRESTSRLTHGGLIARDIFTRGNHFAPPYRGAVLEMANSFSYATLAAHASIPPTKLDMQQEVYYILSGHGTITAAGETADLQKGIAVLMPVNLEFTIKNTGDDPLAMYLLNEPCPAENFTPNTKMLVKDVNKIPFGANNGHWAHHVKGIFRPGEGLGTVGTMLFVAYDPLTIGEPHPHHYIQEEVWTAIDGTSLAFLGTQLRMQPPGTAYMIRDDGMMTMSNITLPNSPATFLFFSTGRRNPRDPTAKKAPTKKK